MEVCNKCRSKKIEKWETYKHWVVYSCQDCDYWTYWHSEQCCKEKFEIVTIDHKPSGQIALYYQCIYCGASSNRKRPLSSKLYSNQIRSEFDNEKFEGYLQKKEEERELLAEQKREYRIYNSKAFKYYQYLSSEEWKEKRELVKKRDSFLCQVCKVNNADEVHHLTYENLYAEKLEELISVCNNCHKTLHKKPH